MHALPLFEIMDDLQENWAIIIFSSPVQNWKIWRLCGWGDFLLDQNSLKVLVKSVILICMVYLIDAYTEKRIFLLVYIGWEEMET